MQPPEEGRYRWRCRDTGAPGQTGLDESPVCDHQITAPLFSHKFSRRDWHKDTPVSPMLWLFISGGSWNIIPKNRELLLLCWCLGCKPNQGWGNIFSFPQMHFESSVCVRDMCVSVCACMCVFMCVCVYVCLCVYLCAYVSLGLCVSMYLYVWYMYICVYVYMRVCTCECMCICVYLFGMCLCVCV